MRLALFYFTISHLFLFVCFLKNFFSHYLLFVSSFYFVILFYLNLFYFFSFSSSQCCKTLRVEQIENLLKYCSFFIFLFSSLPLLYYHACFRSFCEQLWCCLCLFFPLQLPFSFSFFLIWNPFVDCWLYTLRHFIVRIHSVFIQFFLNQNLLKQKLKFK